uniref:Putative group ii salivary lipocalin n=1 Tax=Rhipicephalus pulchellus TaxID=72859 RepID=L7LQA7_RHIPC
MRFSQALATVTFALSAFHIESAVGQAAQKHSRHVTDAFELFAKIPYVALEYTSSDDPEFPCLTNKQVQLDRQEKTATYVWMFRGFGETDKKNVTFYLKGTDLLDTVTFTLDNDEENSFIAKFVYTDYKTCVIVELPYDGDQCQLWAGVEHKNNVPQHCLEKLDEICGATVEVYNEQLCKDDADDL